MPKMGRKPTTNISKKWRLDEIQIVAKRKFEERNWIFINCGQKPVVLDAR